MRPRVESPAISITFLPLLPLPLPLRSISFLAFSQGWIGCILGGAFLLLALFNFFIIYRVRRTALPASVTDN